MNEKEREVKKMGLNYKDIYYGYVFRQEVVDKQIEESKEKGLDIFESALIRLEGDGFDIEEEGTMCLARLIEMLYHERELLQKYHARESYKGYWDLNDKSNSHYYRVGNGDSERIISEIRRSIWHSSCEDNRVDLNELAYDLADKEIAYYEYYQQDDPEKSMDKAISYIKILKNNNRE
jgi:hypothetical protein